MTSIASPKHDASIARKKLCKFFPSLYLLRKYFLLCCHVLWKEKSSNFTEYDSSVNGFWWMGAGGVAVKRRKKLRRKRLKWLITFKSSIILWSERRTLGIGMECGLFCGFENGYWDLTWFEWILCMNFNVDLDYLSEFGIILSWIFIELWLRQESYHVEKCQKF